MKIIEPKVELWRQEAANIIKVVIQELYMLLIIILYIKENIKLKLYLMVKDNAKIIAGMIRNNLMELGYDFRD